jgi:hypothetical protein
VQGHSGRRIEAERAERRPYPVIGQRHDFYSLSSGQFIIMVFRTFTRLMRKDLNIFSRPTFWADLWEWLSCYSHWMPSMGSDTTDGMDEVRGGG